MGFFKWLDKHARESNESWHRGYVADQERRKAEEESEKRYKDSIQCCANCFWFTEWSTVHQYWCSKHEFSFDAFDASWYKIHHKKTCDSFRKK